MSAHGPELIEKAAEALFAHEYQAYSPDAHPDHNRWTWRGDGPSETERAAFRMMARAVLDAVADDLRAGALEEAADEFGHRWQSDMIPAVIVDRALRDKAAEIRAGAS